MLDLLDLLTSTISRRVAEDSPPRGLHDKGRTSKQVTGALDLLCVAGQLRGILKEKNQYLHLKPRALPTALLN